LQENKYQIFLQYIALYCRNMIFGSSGFIVGHF
jgi:hypothetical protein